MGKKDWAIVVGIDAYPDPGLGDLEGPVNDAEDFINWLRSKTGGDVPEKQILKILTSDFKEQMPFTSVAAALPSQAEVERAIESLHELVQQSRNDGNGPQFGERLYIYMTGHGFAPSTDEAALFMANTRYGDSFGHHILGKYNTEWFYNVAAFKEILLFMDCCRWKVKNPPLNKPYWSDTYDDEAADKVKAMHFFAATYGRVTREIKETSDGTSYGVFTRALITGLEGSAADKRGRVTTTSLAYYLTKYMEKFMSEGDRNNIEVSKVPAIFPFPAFPPKASNFTIVTVTHKPKNLLEKIGQIFSESKPEAPKFRVLIKVPPNLQKMPLAVLDGKKLQPVHSIDAAPAEWELELERGKYVVQANGKFLEPYITVQGYEGDLDVNLENAK